MRRLRPIYYIVLVFIFSGAAVYLVSILRDREPATAQTRSTTPPVQQPLKKSVANLYFADRDNQFLIAEARTLTHAEDPVQLGRAIIDALQNGPGETLAQTLPEGTVLRAFYVAENGTAYVDLGQSVSENHPGGCKSEMLTIYSLVNSLVLNIPEIDSVKILIGGGEAATLGGHIDLRFPFKANMLFVR